MIDEFEPGNIRIEKDSKANNILTKTKRIGTQFLLKNNITFRIPYNENSEKHGIKNPYIIYYVERQNMIKKMMTDSWQWHTNRNNRGIAKIFNSLKNNDQSRKELTNKRDMNVRQNHIIFRKSVRFLNKIEHQRIQYQL